MKFSLADRAWQGFHGIFRAVESERMHNIRTGNPKMNRNARWNQNAMRNKQVLLRNHAHCHRAVRILLSSKITLDKLSSKVKRQRIYVVRPRQKPQQWLINLIVARGRNQAQSQHCKEEYTQLSPFHSPLSLRIDYVPNSFSTALQRSHTVGYSLSSPT